MLKNIIMFLLFVFWTLPAFAQDTLWSRTYGGIQEDFSLSVQQTTDGGYISVGWTNSFGTGGEDVYLIKTDSYGNLLWTHTYGGTHEDYSSSVEQTTDGGYIVVGHTNSFVVSVRKVYLIKTNSSGDTLWTHFYGGGALDVGSSVQQTPDGGYMVAGVTQSFGAGSYDFYLFKTNSLGDILWTRAYGGSSSDECYSFQQTKDDGYILAGYTESFGAGHRDVYLIKTDSVGDTLWSRTYGGSFDDQGFSVKETEDGGYIVVGQTDPFGDGYYDVYVIKTDSVGHNVWTRTYGGTSVDVGYSIQKTKDGGCIIAGETSSFGASDGHLYLIKINSNGDILWSRTCGGSDAERAYSVEQTTDGGYIVAGETYSFGAGQRDVILNKLDSLGNACNGRFVSSTVKSVSPIITSPTTVVTSTSTIVGSAATIVTLPPTIITTACSFVCGDANGDGIIDIGDVVYLINYLYKNSSPPFPIDSADTNCDGVVDVGDVVYLINYLFKGGPPPCC
jgi:hypothetical protein